MSKKSKANGAEKMSTKKYMKELRKLQGELCNLQEWVKHKGLRVIIVFEGRDAAGKGGTIRALTERVSPRVFRVVALPAPSDREKSQLYLQRYAAFPAKGEVAFLTAVGQSGSASNTSWVSAKEQHARFLKLPGWEYLVEGGIQLIKIWLESSDKEQKRRSRRAWQTRCASGNSARWTCPRAPSGLSIRGRGT
jgi:polyphosphate kinase 2 (PPK2 family)